MALPSPTASFRSHAVLRSVRFSIAWGVLLALAAWAGAAEPAARAADPKEAKVDFNRQVRPILSENCFSCHGPDEEQRKKVKTQLRLDTKDGLFAKLDDIYPVVPGDPAHSEIYKRIVTKDDSDHMPKPQAGLTKQLSAAQIQIIERWIHQGAEWKQHWAFVAPVLPTPPKVTETAWVRNDIDRFVLARYQSARLEPGWQTTAVHHAPEADRATLIRRLSLDIIGLPPTTVEIDAFLADRSEGAYEKVVDRLLASPRYGERMAMSWMDGARYADSNGYQSDAQRNMWRWRDWVIDAYNRNLPFDQFTIEQLAGDLLPNPTLDQRIATGFNRNHRINTEGGIIPEEWLVETVIDRVDTMGQVWLGLTLGCARCHDHKYDPVSQKEFYQLTAFFNNVNGESGMGQESITGTPPIVSAPTAQDQKQAAALDAQTALDKRALELSSDLAHHQADFERLIATATGAPENDDLAVQLPLAKDATDLRKTLPNGAWKGGSPSYSNGGVLDGDAVLASAASIEFGTGKEGPRLGRNAHFTWSAWIRPHGGGDVLVLSRSDEAQGRGFQLRLNDRKPVAILAGGKQDDGLKITAKEALSDGVWSLVSVSYNGSAKAEGLRVAIDGRLCASDTQLDKLSGDFEVDAPLRIGSHHAGQGLVGGIADVRLYLHDLGSDELLNLALQALRPIAALPEAQRGKVRQAALADAIAHHLGDPTAVNLDLAAIEKLRKQLQDSIPTVMVMEEMGSPRQCWVLQRGQYDKHGEPVSSATPAAFPPMPKGAPNNRLGLARWITDPANPLTARVAVNRLWERLFGTGLVKTLGNFGSQGELPSHPELLDWLACEYIAKGWDTKAMIKLLVMSATYRQSSVIDAQIAKLDPDNRKLTHGPRFRLQAETIRDQALAVAGLLAERIGGPPVHPYQPPGIWDELSNYGNMHNYQHDQGENLYRRSLYTIWKRTTPPPDMVLFDSPSHEYCLVHRARTDTPLQALTLLNDETFVEAGRVLGALMIRNGASQDERLSYGFRRAVGRKPTSAELGILRSGLGRRLSHYHSDLEAAKQLISEGETHSDPSIDPAELAAYATVGTTLLNLDETITKE